MTRTPLPKTLLSRLRIAAHAAALLVAAACAPSAFGQGEPIRIGAVVSATGPVGFLGDTQQKSLELHVKRINDAGGLLGRRIALTVYDDQSDPNNANTFARRLIDSDKVDLLIGGTTSPSALAMALNAERSGVPYIATGASLALVEPLRKWVFKVPHSDDMIAERLLKDMKDGGISRIVLLTDTGSFGQSGRKEVAAAAGKYGVTILGEDTFGPRDTDVTPQITKLRGLANAQGMLVFCGAGPGAAVVLKNAAQLGVKLPIWMPHAAVSPELLKLGGAATEGVRFATPPVLPEILSDGDVQKRVVEEYFRSYRDAYNSDSTAFGAVAADALAIGVDAIRRAGRTDKAAVRDAIEKTSNFVRVMGPFTLTTTDHNGLTFDSLKIIEVRNGRFALAR